MLVHQLLENSAQKYPEKEVLWDKGKWYTYKELEAQANRVSNYLIENGVRRGDRVAILLENSFEYVVAYYAILKAGAVTVELNTEILAEDFSYLLNHSEAVGLITQKKYLNSLQKIATELSFLRSVLFKEDDVVESDLPFHVTTFNELYQKFPSVNPAVRAIDIDLASIIYTSGSTGKPKGVMLTHLNILTNTRSIVEYLELSENDRIMVVLPFFYVYGKSLLNTHIAVGGSMVLYNSFTFPNKVLQAMIDTECTGFAGVPSHFSLLLNKSSVRKYTFPKLRYLTQAGGAMAPTLQKEVALVFYPAKLYIMYGATEASARLSYLDPRELPRRWGSIGKAIPNVELFVADSEGNPLPPGEVGEIVARGANIMVGYWKDEEETSRVLRNGLYFTGDLGKMDEDGFLYVVGRSKDMIKVGANRISAKEIEEKILEHEGILETAVVGVEDEVLGEAIKAFVVKKNNGVVLDEQDIISFCKQRLPTFKVPKYVEFRDTLPKTGSGKINKLELKKQMEKS